MTQHQFEELKRLLRVNHKMLCRIYTENGGKLERLSAMSPPASPCTGNASQPLRTEP